MNCAFLVPTQRNKRQFYFVEPFFLYFAPAWCWGAVTELGSHQCGPCSIPSRCYWYVGWVCCCCFLPCFEGFLRVPQFQVLPPQKPTSPNANSTRTEDPPIQPGQRTRQFNLDRGPAWKPAEADVAYPLNIKFMSVFVSYLAPNMIFDF